VAGGALVDGPRWYRARIRGWGPLLGVLLPGLIGAFAYGSLRLSETAWSGAVGLVGGVLAAPGLLAAGAPFGDRGLYPAAIAASGVMWMAVGLLASRRATRHPLATWGDYWRHYMWMAGGIWVGAGIALGAATFVVGDPLF
jgi:hypothetical protein